MDASFWSGRKVLVTGHTGFKGSWLSLWLSRLGAESVGFALAPPSEPSLFESARVGDGMVDVRGDVRDLAALHATMAEHQPEIVFHLAAQPLVRLSYAQPVETFGTNVLGTVHLLEASRHVESVRSVVIVTSDKCYENKEWAWGYRENEPLGGRDPYSASKGCAEIAAAAYRQSYFADDLRLVGVATARAGNVIGGGDWALDRLLPDAARALAENQTIVARRPASIRPWQHVLEPLRGYLSLAENLHRAPAEYSGAWNFGPRDEDAAPVADVLDRFVDHWGSGAWRSEGALTGPHEAHLLKLDSSKARHGLGWRPALSLDEAIEMTAAWYREADTASGHDIRELSCRQIAEYEHKAGVRSVELAPAPRTLKPRRQAA